MRKLGILFGLLLLTGTVVRQSALAQFIGFVSPQTTSAEAFDAVTCADNTFSAIQRNVGQSAHFLDYSISGGTVQDFQIVIQFSSDGITFENLTDPGKSTPGLLFGTGYFPVVRAAILTCTVASGTPVITANYSGTSVSVGTPAGLQLLSGTNFVEVVTGADATTTQVFNVSSPFQNASGIIRFEFTTGPSGGAQFELDLGIQKPNEGFVSTTWMFTLGAGTGPQYFFIPPAATTDVRVKYNFASAPVSGVYRISYFFQNTQPPDTIQFRFPSQNSTGTTDFLRTGCSLPLTTTGSAMASCVPTRMTIQLATSGSPTTCTYVIEGSIDTSNFFDLSGTIDCTSTTMFHIIDRPVRQVRGNLTALAGGASPTVTFTYLGVSR